MAELLNETIGIDARDGVAGGMAAVQGRGAKYPIKMLIPPVPGNCREIPAGPILFVLESRLLNAGIFDGQATKVGLKAGTSSLEDDAGVTLHVYGAADGLEHLRFDCFEKQPHYHYLWQSDQLNQNVPIDDVALDPIEFTLTSVRNRLPEMLDHAGANELAAAVRSDRQSVDKAINLVAEKLMEISRTS